MVTLADGVRKRISGTPAINTKAAAVAAERAHIERTLRPELDQAGKELLDATPTQTLPLKGGGFPESPWQQAWQQPRCRGESLVIQARSGGSARESNPYLCGRRPMAPCAESRSSRFIAVFRSPLRRIHSSTTRWLSSTPFATAGRASGRLQPSYCAR